MAKRKFTLFHLSMKAIQQKDIETIDVSREQWLRIALAKNFIFNHRGTQYYWVSKRDLNNHIFGVVQRKRMHESHLPSNQGGGEIVNEEWIGAYIILDPQHHEDGQKIAFENDAVGDPDAILSSLISYLNQSPASPFVINHAPIFSSREFWKFAHLNNYQMKSISFKFIAPNMWGTRNALEDDLAETKNQTNADEIDVKLAADDGVDASSQIVTDGVEYIQQGTGRITANSMTGERFDSNNEKTVTNIPKGEENSAETRNIFTRLLDIIMGRVEEDDDDEEFIEELLQVDADAEPNLEDGTDIEDEDGGTILEEDD